MIKDMENIAAKRFRETLMQCRPDLPISLYADLLGAFREGFLAAVQETHNLTCSSYNEAGK